MKKMLNILCVIQLLVISNALEAKNLMPRKEKPSNKNDNVICITMPKGGTHLLRKCIALFNIPWLRFAYNNIEVIKPSKSQWKIYNRVNKFDPPHHYKGVYHTPSNGPLPKALVSQVARSTSNKFFTNHWPYTPEAEEFIAEKSIGAILIIRDPRAVLVSTAHMVKNGWHGEEANVEDLIWDFIDGRKKSFIRWGVTVCGTYPLIWELGITDFYKLYLPWMKAKKFLTIRFEDLVGPKGGGSEAVQLKTIADIAKHINIQLSPEEIKRVGSELFGGTNTFREGKIDGWKKHFTPEMKAAYKRVPGASQLLIDLGYEKDANW